MGLGGYPTVSLKDARAAARATAAGGGDPVVERQRKGRDAAAEAEARTFKAVALAFIKAQAPG